MGSALRKVRRVIVVEVSPIGHPTDAEPSIMGVFLAFPLLLTIVAGLGGGQPAVIPLSLHGVTEFSARREIRLQVESRVRFELDTIAQTVTSSGSWTAQYVMGPMRLVRHTHRLEDFSASADGWFSVRSYECIDGTMGATMLGANVCGNYRFGPNGLDDGGYGDDVRLGPPKSLDGYRLESFEWNGTMLVITLATATTTAEEKPASRLVLDFRPGEPR